MKKLYTLFLFICTFSAFSVKAQLATGDIAFVHFSKEEDGFGIVALKNIPATSTIYFHDGQWNGSSFVGSGVITWTTASEITAGTVVKFNTVNTTAITTPSSVTQSITGSYGLGSNDAVWCYTGTATTPAIFYGAIANGTEGNSFGTLANTGLTANSTAILLTDGTDEGRYVGPRNNPAINGHLASLSNVANNWQIQITGTVPALDLTAFTFNALDIIAPIVTFNPANSALDVNVNSPITLTFDEAVRLVNNNAIDNTNVDALVELKLNNSGGSAVAFDATFNGQVITITPNAPFVQNQTYYVALKAGVIEDTNDNATALQSASFTTINSRIGFEKKFVSVNEQDGTVSIKLNVTNPSVSSVQLTMKGSPWSTASSADVTFSTKTINLTGGSELVQTITIPVINDTEGEQDEYLILSLESATGLSVSGSPYITIFIKDNDRLAPQATKAIELSLTSSYAPPVAGTAEIVVHDPASKRLFVISSIEDRLDIVDFSNPAAPAHIKSVDMASYGGITSVATKNGVVAVASPNAVPEQDGSVVFFTTDGAFLKQITVGALPDMVTFTPDGNKVLTANEGQPNDSYSVDPEGSVSVIDISGGISNLSQSNATTLLFTAFNSQESTLITSGVRKLKATSTLSQDFEPEYISISADSKKAWITLQENNAIAELNLETKSYVSVWPLGKKDFSVFGNGFDASDNSGVIENANWPVKGFYIPDAIANYSVGTTQYLVTANEGDEKEYSGLTERTTVGAVTLDPTVFPHAAVLKENHNLGRLRMTNLSGDTDSDGDYDEINIPGGRSFTIWNAATKSKVFDSGDQFEMITAADPVYGALFNADHESNALKNRSRSKGPEPEGVTVASFNNKTYAFISLERIGGVMTYDITDPANVKFVDYKNNRGVSSLSGDRGAEGITFISKENSPNGKRYILVANEISGTVSVYEVTGKDDQTIDFTNIPDKTMGDAVFTLSATASSALDVTFTTADPEVTIAGKQVTLVKAGRVTITANQVGNTSFNAAPKVEKSFCVNPAQPSITLSGQDTETVTLASSAASGNQWYKNGTLMAGATNQNLAVTAEGIYSVKVTLEECKSISSADKAVIVTGVTSKENSQLSTYPNPAKDQILLSLPDSGSKEILIYNANGVVVHNLHTEQAKEVVGLEAFAAGYFIVKVKTSKGIYFERFIKQ